MAMPQARMDRNTMLSKMKEAFFISFFSLFNVVCKPSHLCYRYQDELVNKRLAVEVNGRLEMSDSAIHG